VDVSIIIPTHDRLWSLPDTIASIPRDARTEIIVVDDGSKDGTWAWLNAQAGVVAIRQENWGKPEAVNRAFERARGRYIRFLDSDDLLRAEAATRQTQFALDRNCDICVAGYVARYEPQGVEVEHPWSDCGDFLAQQLGECDSSHYSAYLFRRDAIAELRHRSEFAFRDDRMFILEAAMNLPTVEVWPEPTLIHRHHPKPRIQFGRGSVHVVTNWQERRMFEAVLQLMQDRGLFSARRGAAMGNNLWELAQRVGAYDMTEAREILKMQRALAPGFEPPAKGRNGLYRLLGFSGAQHLVNLARGLRDSTRSFRANG
jgi:glycosyltransferase involved in cell wall biosynthesis